MFEPGGGRRKSHVPQARACAAHRAAGRTARKTIVLHPVATNGTLSTPEASAQSACAVGLRLNDSHATYGRRIRSRTQSERTVTHFPVRHKQRSMTALTLYMCWSLYSSSQDARCPPELRLETDARFVPTRLFELQPACRKRIGSVNDI